MSEKKEPRHPGQILLEDFLIPNGLLQTSVASHLGWTYARLNEIINARRGLTANSALTLAEAFGTNAEFWMDLQRDWELWNAKKEYKSVIPIQEARVKD